MTTNYSALAGRPLTQREFQAAWLYASGLPRKQVAARLGLTTHSAAWLIKKASRKLLVEGKWGLVVHFEADGAL